MQLVSKTSTVMLLAKYSLKEGNHFQRSTEIKDFEHVLILTLNLVTSSTDIKSSTILDISLSENCLPV